MSLRIVGAGTWQDAQRGVGSPETGISIRRWAVRFFPEINEKLPDNVGQIIARAIADKPSRDITMEGEVTGTTGVMAFAWAVAITYAFQNDLQWGIINTTGFIIMDEVTQTEERAGWKSINMRLSSNPECHA